MGVEKKGWRSQKSCKWEEMLEEGEKNPAWVIEKTGEGQRWRNTNEERRRKTSWRRGTKKTTGEGDQRKHRSGRGKKQQKG